MRIEKDLFVEMRDGVGLAVDLYQPDRLESHAAILMVTPYRKDATFTGVIPLTSEGRRMILPVALPPAGSPPVNPMLAGVQSLVDAGFVVAAADARGTGFSEGVWDYYNMDGGPYDGYDLVEWLAAQPWCTGQVGMMGASAAAIYCHITALTEPPHLRALAADQHPGDFYFDQWYVGGVFRWENRIGWATSQYANISLLDPGEPDSTNYERKRAVYEERFHRAGERIRAGKNPANLDWLTDLYGHRDYDAHWQRWSFMRGISELQIPVLYGGVWFDHFARGTITSYEALRSPKRLVMKPGSLVTRLDLALGDFEKTKLAWFDHFLRGEDNGVLDEPPVRLYLMGREDYVDEPQWPVPAIETSLFLASGPSGSIDSLNDGTLQWEPADDGDAAAAIAHVPDAPNRTPRDVFDQRAFERGCLTFTSPVLERDVEVIGTPRVALYASTDAPDVDWCVRLCDVDEDGRSKLLNVGALKGSHVDSHERPEPLAPGTVYRFDIEIWPIANLFKAGHRIRLDISTSDFPFFESNQHASTSTVFHDTDRRSALVLPVVQR